MSLLHWGLNVPLVAFSVISLGPPLGAISRGSLLTLVPRGHHLTHICPRLGGNGLRVSKMQEKAEDD